MYFTFQAYTLPHTLNCIGTYVLAYLNFIFEYLPLSKQPVLPRHIEMEVSFELFGALYVYISDQY